jgi:hypothetical protein
MWLGCTQCIFELDGLQTVATEVSPPSFLDYISCRKVVPLPLGIASALRLKSLKVYVALNKKFKVKRFSSNVQGQVDRKGGSNWVTLGVGVKYGTCYVFLESRKLRFEKRTCTVG